MSNINIVPFLTREQRELRDYRERTIASLRPRLEAIAKQHDQKALILAVCNRAAHL